MSEIKRLVAAIERKNAPEKELSRFVNLMTETAYRLSGMQLAFRLAGLPEEEEGAVAPAMKARLLGLVKDSLTVDFSGAGMEKLAARILAYRQNCAGYVKEALRLADVHDLADHMAARLEAGLFPERFPALPSDEEIIAQAYRYVAGNGSEGTGLRMQMLQKELPMRLSRGRFLDHVRGVFALYEGQQGQTLTDFADELLSAAGERPAEKAYALAAAEEEKVREAFLTAGDPLTPEAYEQAREALAVCGGQAQRIADALPEMAGAAGMLLVRVLAGPYVLSADPSDETVADVLKKLSAGEHPDEAMNAAFETLEGRDLELLADWQDGAAALADIRKHCRLLIDSLMLGPMFANLLRFDAWLTGGNFADPDDPGDIKVLEKADIAEAFEAFEKALTPVLQQLPRAARRSVMACIMGKLPPFAGNTEDVKAYLRGGITSCTDETEKKGFVSVLHSLQET